MFYCIGSRRYFPSFPSLTLKSIKCLTQLYRYIPYLADTDYLSESEYLHCGDRLQSAVTHSGRTNNIWVVSFQWRPPQHFSGHVTFR